jgi:hypothetical protein
MDFTATPETGPVDASAMDSLVAQFTEDTPAPADSVESIAQEMVNDPEGKGEAEAEADAPATEDDATDPAEQAEEPETDTPATEQTVTVKVNGEDREVPLSEALAGYSRLEDYKAKTAEVAEQRRNLEAKATTIEAEVKGHYATQLEEATNLFAQFDPVLAEARTINWDALKASDPAAYVQAQDAVNARLNAIQQMQQQVAAHRGQAEQAQTQAAEKERAERFDRTVEKIVAANPDLADEGKFQAFANEAVGFLRETGFTDAEIADALDERVLTLAADARRWKAHEAAQKALPEKRIVPKSAIKPLTTDAGSRAASPRLSANASREKRTDWVLNQLLSEE